MYDVVVVGSGIIGGAVARELSRYPLKIAILEKDGDVAEGATMANSAIVHAGYDPKPGTLKARFNVEGCAMFPKYCEELDALYKPLASIIVAFSEEELVTIKELYDRGLENGARELRIIDQAELRSLEPNLVETALGALYAGSSGIFEPWGLTIAMIENAMDNGTELYCDSEVTDIRKTAEGFRVVTANGRIFDTKVVINAAGLYSDKIHDMVCEHEYTIRPRKGHYFVMDKPALSVINHVFFPCPSDKGKGILIFPAIHDKLLLGPDSEFIDDKDDVGTQAERLNVVRETTRAYVKSLPMQHTIRSFAGLRATSDQKDYIIKENDKVKGFFDVAGIESPGLTSAPAIGVYVAQMVVDSQFNGLEQKSDFIPRRRKVHRLHRMTQDERKAMIEKDPKYGTIICRCELVTEGEIIDSIHRNCGARTVKGVKKRIGPGFGRCQGGFCQSRVVEILARELKIDKMDVEYDRPGSNILIGKNKTGGDHHA
jgi:glycerol-3-phosphate dehydrogenase